MKRDATPPAPFSTEDCDLRGLEWMPLNTADLLDSTLFLKSTGDEFKAAMALFCKSWRQVPAGSLPNDDDQLAVLSMARDWTSVRTMALRKWVLCSDGRLYHPIVAAKAMEALPMRQEFVEKKTSDKHRKEVERKDRKDMFAKLRGAGIVLHYSTKTTELRERIQQLESGAQGEPVTQLVTPLVTGGSRDASHDLSRLGQGQGQGQGQDPLIHGIEGTESQPLADDSAPPGDGGEPFEGGDGDPPVAPDTPGLPHCPHLKLLKLWQEVLPELPQHDPDEWSGQRRDQLQARWREKAAKLKWPDEQTGLTYFRRLFAWIRKSRWCMGQVPPAAGRRQFKLELQWLVRPNNWPNVLEGKYHEDE